MPRPKSLKPAYCHHKSSGRAYVTLDGARVYLGTFGSQESQDKYDRLIGEWIARGRQCVSEPQQRDASTLTVGQLLAAYWAWAKTYYVAPAHGPDGEPLVKPDGSPLTEPAGELTNYRHAMQPLKRLYGATRATEFGPLALRALVNEFVRIGWCRNHVNRQLGRIKAIFKWGVSQELIPPAVHQALITVPGLRAGKSSARETAPVRPVPLEQVEAVLPHVSTQVAAIIRLQLLTGARGGELLVMRTRDIDTSGKVWVYRPRSHKTAHHGHKREIFLGPQAQEVLRPFLKPDLAAFVFSPADAEAERLAQRRAGRKTPVRYGNSIGTNRKRRPKWKPRARYDKCTYAQAIDRACEVAWSPPTHLARGRKQTPGRKKGRWETPAEWKSRLGPERWAELNRWRRVHHWHPHQLRHTAATRLRREFGLETARILLGHQSAEMTEVYAEADVARAAEVMGQVG
jgi:integrase